MFYINNLRDLSILLISLQSTILRIIDKHTRCFRPSHLTGQIKSGCLKDKGTKIDILFSRHKILHSQYCKHGYHFAYSSCAVKGT